MARKNALFDVLGDAYVRGMARNVNALAEIAGKPFPDPRVYARGAEFVPGVGDAVGLAQDVRGYAENPSSLTPWAALGSLAALAPGVPRTRVTPKGGGMFSIFSGDKLAGHATLAADGDRPFMSVVRLENEFKRKGIGSEAYDQIEKIIGRKLVPSPLGLSDEAAKFWRSRLSKMSPSERRSIIDESFKIGEEYGLSQQVLAERLSVLTE